MSATRRTFRALLGLVSFALALSAAAADSQEVQRGLGWLTQQPRADGSVAAESSSIAHPLQVRAEVHATLRQLASAPAPLADRVAGESAEVVEFMARRISTLAPAGRDVTPIVTALLQRQNADGGFGGATGYRSNALDTALALRAFKASGASQSTAIANAVAWLQANQASNGSFVIGDPDSVYSSAEALQALSAHAATYPSATTINAARAWLIGRQQQGSYGSAFQNAEAILALIGSSVDTAPLVSPVAALKGAQGPNGDWGGDPYVTALAVRALAAADEVVPPSSTGQISGVVVETASGDAHAGVQVQITGPQAATVSTDSNGTFLSPALTPGTYTVQVSKVGYTSASASATVSAGVTTLLGTIRLAVSPTTAVVKGTVRDGASGQALEGATVAIAGGASAVTDASGRYEIGGILPGSISITVSSSGYQSVAATTTVSGGTVYTFSPSLYPPGQSPPTSISGRVVDRVDGTGISGATVRVGTVSAATTANGDFQLDGITAGSVSIEITAAGFSTLTLSGTLAPGANNLGVIQLERQQAGTGTVTGRVFDNVTSLPLGGATVRAQGTAFDLTAATNANGNYTIAGITQASYTIAVAAPGYVGRTVATSGASVEDRVVDVGLDKLATGALSLKSVSTNLPTYPPHSAIEIEVEVLNSGTTPIDVIFDAQIFNSANEEVLAAPAFPYTIPPTAAAAPFELELEVHSASLPPGMYRVVARGRDAGGTVVLEGSASFQIQSVAKLGGGLVLDPPILQAGTQQPVKLTASLVNHGNTDIPSGQLEVVVSLAQADPQATALPRLELLPSPAAGGSIQTPVGAGLDAEGNLYVVNKTERRVLKIGPAPDNATTIVATLPQSFDNPTLAVDVQDAVADSQGTVYVLNNRREIFTVAPNGAISRTLTGLTAAGTDNQIAFDRAADGTFYVVAGGGQANKIVRVPASGSPAIFPSSGLSNPRGIVRAPDGYYYIVNNGDSSISRMGADGSLVPWVTTGLFQPQGIAVDSQGDLYVANTGSNNVVKIVAKPDGTGGSVVTPAYATGFSINNGSMPPSDLRFDSSGALFVTAGGALVAGVYRVPPGGGTAQVWARTLTASPRGLAYGTSGNLYVNSGLEVVRKDASDNVDRVPLNLSNGQGIAANDAGTVFAASGSNGTIVRIVGLSGASWATGLGTPYGLTVDPAGKLYVTESSANRIAAYNSLVDTPVKETVVESMINVTRDVRVVGTDRLVLNANSIGRLPQGSRGTFHVQGDLTFSSAAVSFFPVGGDFLVQEPNAVKRVTGSSVAAVGGLPGLARGIAADPSGAALVAVATGNTSFPARSILTVTPAGAVSIKATLPDAPVVLIEDGAGGAYVAMSNGRIARVTSAGAVSEVTTVPISPAPTRMALDFEGNKIYLLSTASGVRVFDVLQKTVAPVGSITKLYDGIAYSAGSLHLLSSATRELHTASLQGVVTPFAAGFATPAPVVWAESRLIFSDASSTFEVVPGGHPTRLLNQRFFHLAWRDGSLYGTRGDANVYVFTPGIDVTPRVHLTPATNATLQGLAFRDDGALTVASSLDGSAWSFDASKQLIASYAGFSSPISLEVRGQDIFVASQGANAMVVRMSTTQGGQSRAYSSVRATGLGFDEGGRLLATVGSSVVEVFEGGGNVIATGAGVLRGVTGVGGTILATDLSYSAVRRVEGVQTALMAIGLHTPKAVRVDASGGAVITSNGNDSLVRFADGRLSLRAGGVSEPQALALTGTGDAIVGAFNGDLYSVDAAGIVRTIGSIPAAHGFVPISAYGANALTLAGNGVIHAVQSGASRIDRLSYTPAGPGPQPGPIVTLGPFAHGPIPVGGALADLELGTWIPPYAGDFELRARPYASTLSGEVFNALHVGPHASAKITTTPQEKVAPGTTTIGVTLTVDGADFATVSRPDARAITLAVPELVTQGLTWQRTFRAMATDASGAIYATNSVQNVIWRYRPSTGFVKWYEPLAGTGSISIGGQIPVDDEQALYVNGGTTGSEVYRVRQDANGVVAGVKIADVGEPIRSMVRATDNSIYALGAASIHRLTRAGDTWTRTTFATEAGNPATWLTIDGKDNLYTLGGFNTFGGSHLTTIRKDGTRMSLLRPDGANNQPTFEGEGFPVVGDCADNVLVAPYTWADKGQSGEEYTMLQINGRTGAVQHAFDGRRTFPRMIDMDSFAFDRWTSSLLIWSDLSPGTIHRMPLTCGVIDTDLHLVLPASQPAAGFSVTPNAVIARPDGSREYVWRFKDVTAAGKGVSLSTTLENLQLGEKRAIAAEAYLTFRNSFTSTGDVKVPVTIPKITADGMVDLELSIDNGVQFPANSEVRGTITLRNRDSAVRSGDLRVEITDAQGERIVLLGEQAVSVAADGVAAYTSTFNTGTWLAGAYAMKATLLSATGAPLGERLVDFYIVSPAVVLIPSVATDKRVYEANDNVSILGRVRNASLNTVSNGHTLSIVVRRGAQAIHTATAPVGLLVPQAMKAATFPLQLTQAPPGDYEVEAQLFNGTTAVGEPTFADFSVLSTPASGSGLAGAVTATREVDLGTKASITATLRNLGNGDLANVAVRIQVLNPANGQVAGEFDDVVTALPIGATREVTKLWDTTGRAPGTYAAVATATLSGLAPIPLGQDSIRVIADTTPDAFSFAPKGDVPAATLVSSDAAVISGITTSVPISVTGGEYSIDGGATWTAATQLVAPNTTVRVRVVSSATPGGTATATLTVSNTSATFTVTTTVEDRSPDAFTFAPVTNVLPGVQVASNQVTVTGINVPVTVSIAPLGGATEAAFSINGGPFTSVSTQLVAQDRIVVRQTAAIAFGVSSTVTLTVGDFSAGFTATTQAEDRTPDAFAFAAQTNVKISTVSTSTPILVSGINTTVPISIAGGAGATAVEYSLNGAAFTTVAGTVKNGDTVVVRQTSSASFATKTTATLTISTVSAAFDITTEAEDLTPDAFVFTAQTGVKISTVSTSNQILVSGINTTVPISIAGGAGATGVEYSVNGAAFTSAAGTVKSNDTVVVRQTSSASFLTKTTATLTISTVTGVFDVTTEAEDRIPDAYTFTPQVDVPLQSVRTSNAVLVAGINTTVPISVTGGEYSVNGGVYTAAAGTVKQGDVVIVRLTSAAAFATKTTATLTISTVSASFEATTTSVAQVALTLGFNADSRVLVLVSCRNSQGGSDPACVEQRRAFLDTLLTSLGVTHLITTDSEPFRVAFRSGRWNTYWISGGAEKLKDTLVEEVREAAFRGETLIADGFHDDRNHFIDEVFGVTYGGNVSPAPTTVLLTGTRVPQGSFTFSGDSIKANVNSGTVEARFDTAMGSPAIVSNVYGAGASVLYAFDLVANLMAQPGSALVKATLTQPLDYAQPTTGQVVTALGYTPFRLEVANSDPAVVDLEVVATLPSFTFLASVPAPAATGETRWNLAVPANGTASLDWAYTAPEAAGTYTGGIVVSQLVNGVKRVIEPSPTPIVVEVSTVASVMPAVIAELQTLTLTVTSQSQARDRAVTALQQAQAAIGASENGAAIPLLIEAVNHLDAVTEVSTRTQQTSIDWILNEVAGRWYRALPVCPATPHCR